MAFSDVVFGDGDKYSLSHRLFILTTFYGIAFSIFGAIVDKVLDLGLALVILPLFIAVVFAVFYYFARFRNQFKHFVLYFIVIGVVTMSYVWIHNGGYDSPNIYIFFNLFMISIIITGSSYRKLVMLFFFIVGTALFFVHLLFPSFITPYLDQNIRFYDQYFTFIYNFFIMFFLVNFTVKSYESEKQKVEAKNKLISEQNIKLESLIGELQQKNELLEEAYTEMQSLNSTVTDQNIELETLIENLTQKNHELIFEQEKSESLLLNVLPSSIANRLKEGETTIADCFDEASVVFIDIVDFTKLASKGSCSDALGPEQVVSMLNSLYTHFDKIAHKYGLEKIKTIGDCYMAASGVPNPREDHAEMAARFALEAINNLNGDLSLPNGIHLDFRCGIDCGPLVAGVIGEKKFIYDLWGDTVNTASRMEEYGEAGKIQVTERFKEKLTSPNPLLTKEGTNDGVVQGWSFQERGVIEIKGKGKMRTYFLK